MTFSKELEELKTLASQPISADAPAGSDSRYEPEYNDLLGEIDKLGSVTQTMQCNWQVVVEKARTVLSTKAKDFQAACYLGVALGYTDGIAGLAVGADVLRTLFTTYWQNGFPILRRVKGRVNALDWWRERTTAMVQDLWSSDPFPAEEISSLNDAVKALDEAVGEVLPDQPAMRELLSYIQRLPVKEPEIVPEPAPAPAPTPVPQTPVQEAPQAQPAVQPQPTPASAPAPAPHVDLPAPPAPSDDFTASLSDYASYSISLGQAAIANDMASFVGWEAFYTGLFCKLSKKPPEDGGTTFVPGPDRDRSKVAEDLLSQGNATGAVQLCLDLASESPFWLDIHRIVSNALSALGPAYAQPAHCVAHACRMLAERVPGVGDLRFADATPFADAATKSWLGSLASGNIPGEGTGMNAPASPIPSSSSAIDDAAAAAASGDLEKALDILDRAQEETRGWQERLPLRLEQVNILMRAERWFPATVLAEELADLCGRVQLDIWSPADALSIWMAVRAAWEGMGGEQSPQRMREATSAIARIRPSRAILA